MEGRGLFEWMDKYFMLFKRFRENRFLCKFDTCGG